MGRVSDPSATRDRPPQVTVAVGVAVLGSVFSATGGLGSPGQFTAGLTNALAVSAAILGVSALVVLLAPETQAVRQAKARPERRGYHDQLGIGHYRARVSRTPLPEDG